VLHLPHHLPPTYLLLSHPPPPHSTAAHLAVARTPIATVAGAAHSHRRRCACTTTHSPVATASAGQLTSSLPTPELLAAIVDPRFLIHVPSERACASTRRPAYRD
jgi:hypothetical protein